MNNTISPSTTSGDIIQNFHRNNHGQSTDKVEIKVVRMGRRELFGLEGSNSEIFNENYYHHYAKVKSSSLKLLVINLKVLFEMEI